MGIDGFLIVDKPEGITSLDVVRQVKRRLGIKKAGHMGTLDPFATGVLPVALGEGTRLIPFLSEEPKRYEGTLKLGEETTTDDPTGEVISRRPWTGVTAGRASRRPSNPFRERFYRFLLCSLLLRWQENLFTGSPEKGWRSNARNARFISFSFRSRRWIFPRFNFRFRARRELMSEPLQRILAARSDAVLTWSVSEGSKRSLLNRESAVLGGRKGLRRLRSFV